MKTPRSFALLLSLMGCAACAQETSSDDVVLELTAPAEIAQARLWRIGDGGFSQGSSTEQLAGLSRERLADLLRARTVLVEFFSALQSDDGDPFRFMTADFARENPDETSLYQSVIGQETTLLQLAITGFTWSGQDGDPLTFFFIPTVFSEGELSVGESQATLRRFGAEWRVASVSPDENGSGFLVERHP